MAAYISFINIGAAGSVVATDDAVAEAQAQAEDEAEEGL